MLGRLFKFSKRAADAQDAAATEALEVLPSKAPDARDAKPAGPKRDRDAQHIVASPLDEPETVTGFVPGRDTLEFQVSAADPLITTEPDEEGELRVLVDGLHMLTLPGVDAEALASTEIVLRNPATGDLYRGSIAPPQPKENLPSPEEALEALYGEFPEADEPKPMFAHRDPEGLGANAPVLDEFRVGEDVLSLTLDPEVYTEASDLRVVIEENGDAVVSVDGDVVAVLTNAPEATTEDVVISFGSTMPVAGAA